MCYIFREALFERAVEALAVTAERHIKGNGRMRDRLKIFAFSVIIALAATVEAVDAATETRFTIRDSSPSSWVARGYRNYTVSPSSGWTITASGGGSTVQIYATGSPLPNTSVDYWRMNFDAPDNLPLVPGVYNNFQRYPFNESGRPGLEFASTGRGDNMAAGTFRVLELTYGPANQILSFAADFTHYGETNLANYAIAEIQYNATVPEPASLSVIAGVSLFIGSRRR